MYTNAEITIINKHFDETERTDKLYMTTIDKVFWRATRGVVRGTDGDSEEDNAVLLIPFDFTSSREYIDPKGYQAKSNPEEYFTLNEGDLIVEGTLDIDIDLEDLESHSEVYVITNVTINDYGSPNMRHFKVGAR